MEMLSVGFRCLCSSGSSLPFTADLATSKIWVSEDWLSGRPSSTRPKDLPSRLTQNLGFRIRSTPGLTSRAGVLVRPEPGSV
ncbi:hypothetical protein NL676_025193 [Syzygium grande]|nr:hypothetical protein NL676_025193 [Syzygium grande]